MGRLCGGAHEISGIKAPIFLCGWVVGPVVVGRGWGGRVGGVGRGGGCRVGGGVGRGVGGREGGGGVGVVGWMVVRWVGVGVVG